MNFFKSILLSLVLIVTFSAPTFGIGTDGDGSGKRRDRGWNVPQKPHQNVSDAQSLEKK